MSTLLSLPRPTSVADAVRPLADLRVERWAAVRGLVGDEVRAVLIGEATHGTEEFYSLRADLTQAMIEKAGDAPVAVCLEADFPAIWPISRWCGCIRPARLAAKAATAMEAAEAEAAVSLAPDLQPQSLEEALEPLKARFPLWLWRNQSFARFCTWLRGENARRAAAGVQPVLLVGLDIYAMMRAAEYVVSYLEGVDPEAAVAAKRRYAALSQLDAAGEAEATERYVAALKACNKQGQVEAEAAAVMSHMLSKEEVYSELSGNGDEFFGAAECAHVASSAEAYYRHSILEGLGLGKEDTWNLRDTSMMQTLRSALSFLERREPERSGSADAAPPPRAIVWAHNSHIGDARATQDRPGRLNLGQLTREHFGEEKVFLLGFSTHQGSVMAATEWGAIGKAMELSPSHPSSLGDLLHAAGLRTGVSDFGLSLGDTSPAPLAEERLQRFVGVIYAKRTELRSHYMRCVTSRQFDFLIHIDSSEALHPLQGPRPQTLDYRKWDVLDYDD